MKNDPPSDWLSLEVMGQKNWDDPAKKWRERRAVAEKSGEAESSISVEIVCFTPAGKSLINSGLVHYLTDLKHKKNEREEKRERETNDKGEEEATGWSDKERVVSLEKRTRRGAVGSFYGPRLPAAIIPLCF